MKYLLTIILIVSGFLVDPAVLRAAMSSTDYYIYADDFSMGGGLSTGGEYSLQDTVGNSPVDIISGGEYALRAGYQFMTRGELTLSVSSSSLDLGTLATATASSSAATTATVTTDSDTGYTLSVSDVSGTHLADVSDGAVDGSSGSEEYGVAVSGTDAAFVNDQAVTSSPALVLASSATAASSNATVLTFKAIRNASTTAATYSQSITLSAVANF